MENKKKFEFKKIDGKCAFIMHSDQIERTELVSIEYARNHYTELVNQKNEMMANLGKVSRELENNKVEKDQELEHFIELANNAHKYKKYMDALENQKATMAMVDSINESIDAIEKVLPEVKRAKK